MSPKRKAACYRDTTSLFDTSERFHSPRQQGPGSLNSEEENEVVGSADLCQKISQGLHESAKERKWEICVHQAESITDVVKTRIDISVDFIIFPFDLKISQTLSEIKANIVRIEESFVLSGAVCVVNCNGVSNVMGLIHEAKKLCHNYNIRFLSANISNMQACVSLGSRILNITEGILGLNSGLPVIGTVVQHN
ncbi:PREDICTED: uncharacterized protein LOC108775328 [Cyphomyrmex costatus]|uniref:uncharacterized protein LOC108775328 n=1 Tax=Cyphomyrmex costatus TaxID=456900 RepID=UPI0008524530|nr:PREDICTED: uncharacterized protein LOC108775328 [Cyphomyrmex costatus]